jgi:hypothetical protein
MSLAEFQPERLTVTAKGVSFDVRGLSIIDISSVIKLHMNDLEALFDMYEQEAQGLSFSNVALAKYATRLIQDAPGLVAHIIALACDEPEQVNNAKRLPLIAQIDALKKIGKLTFEEVGGVKKLIAEMSDLVSQFRPASSQPQNPPAKK